MKKGVVSTLYQITCRVTSGIYYPLVKRVTFVKSLQFDWNQITLSSLEQDLLCIQFLNTLQSPSSSKSFSFLRLPCLSPEYYSTLGAVPQTLCRGRCVKKFAVEGVWSLCCRRWSKRQSLCRSLKPLKWLKMIAVKPIFFQSKMGLRNLWRMFEKFRKNMMDAKSEFFRWNMRNCVLFVRESWLSNFEGTRGTRCKSFKTYAISIRCSKSAGRSKTFSDRAAAEKQD